MPAAARTLSTRATQKPMPGSPSRHLPEVNSTASHSGCSSRRKGSAPKAETLSMISRRPAARTTGPITAGSLTMPLPVSLCTASTWVMAGSAASAAAISSPVTGLVSVPSMPATTRPASVARRTARSA